MIADLIYDVGMNNGDDTAFYLHRGYRVLAIEANPDLVASAVNRFRNEIASNQLTILNIGIASEEGELPFWICETQPEWSSFHRSIAARNGCAHREIRVRSKTFISILRNYGTPFYLKVDIEGNDPLCLQGIIPEDLPKFVSVEGGPPSMLRPLLDFGFTRFKCISQFNLLPIQCTPTTAQRRYEFSRWLNTSQRSPVRQFRSTSIGRRWIHRELGRPRRFGDWTFPHGSSGPFGDDLPGRWLDFDELLRTYEDFLLRQQRREPGLFWKETAYSFWIDYHARRD